jgi:flagellum-specific peptidoglycan hydrolase FlgJ
MMLKMLLFLAAVVSMCQQSAAAAQNPHLQPGNKSDRSFIGRHSVEDNVEGSLRPRADTSHRRLASSVPSRAPTIRHSSTISKSTPTEQPTTAPNTGTPTISPALVATTDAPTNPVPNPVVALRGFSFAITADDTDTAVNQEYLTTTLEEYMTDGMLKAYPNALVVTLQQRLRRQRRLRQVSITTDYSGFIVFSGTAPPVKDVHDLQQNLLEDTALVQAAVNANPSIGQDVVVQRVAFETFMDDGAMDDGVMDDGVMDNGVMDNGGMENGGDNNGAIIGGVIGGSVLVLAVVALLITRRRTNPSDNLQSGITLDDDQSSENMEQPIANKQQQTDVDNDDLDAAAVELKRYKATSAYQSAFEKNREDFVNSLKPHDSPITVKKAFDMNREAFEQATKEEMIGNMEYPIANKQKQTDVDNDALDVSAVELERYKATAEYQNAFEKNREDFVNSLKPNASPSTVKKAFDMNREAFEQATKEGMIGRLPLMES